MCHDYLWWRRCDKIGGLIFADASEAADDAGGISTRKMKVIGMPMISYNAWLACASAMPASWRRTRQMIFINGITTRWQASESRY